MVFGEIVEPTTRALINEDLDEYPEYIQPIPEWEGNAEPPLEIESLTFIETERITKLFQSCVIGKEQKPVSKINNAGIEIFEIDKNKYLIVFSQSKEFTHGELTEVFDKWVRVAKKIYTITSNSIHNYQKMDFREKPPSLLKMLSNDDTSSTLGCERLESPNFIIGLGAGILSYCMHLGLKYCSSFVLYVDSLPSDSLNMGPLLELIEKLDIPLKTKDVSTFSSSNNLYM